jgi:hypothetical protein
LAGALIFGDLLSPSAASLAQWRFFGFTVWLASRPLRIAVDILLRARL